jgi:hypothetical protein
VIGEGGGQQPVTVSVLVSTTATAPAREGISASNVQKTTGLRISL